MRKGHYRIMEDFIIIFTFQINKLVIKYHALKWMQVIGLRKVKSGILSFIELTALHWENFQPSFPQ